MLDIQDIHLKIGDTDILTGVNFSIERGEKVGLIGPNGSGKTTLFNCISGFNTPNRGRITFKGHEITRMAPHKRAALGLGRVFQNFGIFKEMTLAENIVTALESSQAPVLLPWSSRSKVNCSRALEYLELVGLSGKAKEKAGSLSGGQMRLLEISRAIAFGSDLFLLDEPTAGVSPKMKNEIKAVLDKLQMMDKTLLIIEHDMRFIHQLCDRIVVLDVGKNVLDGTPGEIRNNQILQEIYFGGQNGDSSDEERQYAAGAM